LFKFLIFSYPTDFALNSSTVPKQQYSIPTLRSTSAEFDLAE